MTVSSTTAKVTLAGNDSTTTFNFSFTIYANTDLVVTFTNSSGVESTLSEGSGTSNYSVSVSSYPGSGSITWPASGSTKLQSNEKITIKRVLPLTQTIDLQNQGGYFPDVQEQGFDRGVYLSQQIDEEVDRSIKIPVSSATSIDSTLPAPTADTVIGAWNSDADAIVAGPTVANISSAESNAVSAAASAVTAAAEASAANPKYTFSTTTSMADPGAGTLRYNHGTVASVSAIALDDTTADTGNPDIEAWIASWDDSTSTVKGWLRLVEPATPANYAVFHITGLTNNSGWVQLAVTHVDSNGTFGNGDSIRVMFSRTGDKGDTGAQGIQGDQGDEAGVLPYVFATSTSDADPGAGKLRFNNGTLSSVSQIFIDDQSNSSGNPDVSALLLTWDDSTNVSDKGTIVVSKKSALQNYFIGRLTSLVDASGYVKLVVTHVTSNGSFSADDDLLVEFQRTGNAGSLDDPMTTRGDMIVRNSSNTTARLAVGSGSTVLKSDGTDISWGYTVGTSANNLVQLNGSAALPAVSGANLTNLPASGGTIDLTASGAVTAGKTLILNSNGTVSQIAATSITQVIGSSYTPTNETAGEGGFVDYNTTADVFMFVNRSTISGSNICRASVLSLNSSMAITETEAPITCGGSGAVYSVRYSAVHDRLLAHYQNGGSPYEASINTVSYSVSNGLDVDGTSNLSSDNRPYGSSIFMGTSDNTIASIYQYANTPSGGYIRFGGLTTGSDAASDSYASDGESDSAISTGGESNRYYSTPIWFPDEARLILLTHGYHSPTDYRVRLGYGSVTGSGGSASYSELGEDNWSDSDRFDYQGCVRYNSDLKRAIWFDGKYLRSISMNGGYNKSSLFELQSGYPSVDGWCLVGIPGTSKIVCFAGDSADGSKLSYWVVTVTTGTNAASDSFTKDSGPNQISTEVPYYNLTAAYSPDVDGFVVRLPQNSAASKTYGVRVARTSTNVTSSNFIGFASNSASDGGTVTVQLPGAVATPTQGSLTVGTKYYVKNDGTIGTSDQSLGIAGRAASSTKLIVEERA